MTILYGIAECCLNCINRAARINNKVICNLTKKLVPERIKCSCYKRTDNTHILSAEKKLIPEQSKSQTLIEWAKKCNILL